MLDLLLLKILSYFTNSSFPLNCPTLALPPSSAAINNENNNNNSGSSHCWWAGRALCSCLTSFPNLVSSPFQMAEDSMMVGPCPRSRNPPSLFSSLCNERADRQRQISPLKWIMRPLPYKGESHSQFSCQMHFFSLGNILLLYIVVMDAACLIRYKKMILNELGFF